MPTTPAPHPVRTASTLLATSLLGRLPQAMSALALVRVVLAQGGGFVAAGGATTAYVIASTVGAPLLGRLIDLTGRRRTVLLGAAVVSALAFGAIAVGPSGAWAVAVLAAVAGLAAPPLEPALRSLWPRLMGGGPALQRAFSADAAAQEVLFILGPLVVVSIAAAAGARAPIVVMSVAVLVGTALFCLHRAVAATSVSPVRGAGSALRIPGVRVLVVVLTAAGLPIGVLTISASAFAERASDPGIAGWALAANAGGALVGALAGTRLHALRPARALAVLVAVLGLLYLPTAASGLPTALWLLAAGIAGLALPPMLTQAFALVVVVAPEQAAVEANAWIVSAFSVGIGLGTLGAGALTGVEGAAGAAGAIAAASGLAAIGALVARLGAAALERRPGAVGAPAR